MVKHTQTIRRLLHNHHHTETHFIFSMFVSMSWPSSIYVVLCDPFLIFSPIFIIINSLNVSAGLI